MSVELEWHCWEKGLFVSKQVKDVTIQDLLKKLIERHSVLEPDLPVLCLLLLFLAFFDELPLLRL